MARGDLVIFDFDGTLVDTAPDLVRSTNFYLESQGFEPLGEAQIRAEIGMGLRKLIVDVYPSDKAKDDNFRRKIEAEFMAIYEREYLHSPAAFPGVPEFLAEWDGHIAIVSNKRARFIQPILEKLGLSGFEWKAIIGGDTYPNMKPHPEPLLAAMAYAGVTPEETVIVGDGSPDVLGALAVGSPCLAVEFGYTPAAELMALGATRTLASFDDLLPLLKGGVGAL